MLKMILSTSVACILICSCASSTMSAVAEDYNDAAASQVANTGGVELMLQERQAHELERIGLMQKIEALGAELSELKTKLTEKPDVPAPEIVALPPAPEPIAQPEPETAPPVAVKPTKSRVSKTFLTAHARMQRETILIQDTGMVFRVMHEFAKTDFHPSPSLQAELLQAARASKRIDIRGRTDAKVANDIDRDIAMQRALNARLFLANNGIHPRKMRLNFLAAGDHVADNTTVDGRGRNRRVEIATAGISRDVMEDLSAVIRQNIQ